MSSNTRPKKSTTGQAQQKRDQAIKDHFYASYRRVQGLLDALEKMGFHSRLEEQLPLSRLVKDYVSGYRT